MGIGNHNTYYSHDPNCSMECPVDGCDYQSDSKQGIAVHCGKSHKNTNPFQVDCECNYCGDTFTIPKSEYKNGRGKYCSKKCKGKNKTEKGTVDCECNYCGDTFTIPKSRYEKGEGKYCSLECRGKNQTEKGTVDCECNYCGDKFTIRKSNYEKGEGKYCSRECLKLDRSVDCECNYCGDTFKIKKSRYENGWDKYCSNECLKLDRSVDCECNYCGDTFTIPKSEYKNGRGKYCSKECYGLDNRCSNPDIRQSPAYRQFRKTVLNRDNHSCVDCGTSDNLHVHHVTPISEDESQATDVANGVTVCIPCHADRHEQRGDDAIASLLRSQNITGFEIGVIDSQQSLETFADD